MKKLIQYVRKIGATTLAGQGGVGKTSTGDYLAASLSANHPFIHDQAGNVVHEGVNVATLHRAHNYPGLGSVAKIVFDDGFIKTLAASKGGNDLSAKLSEVKAEINNVMNEICEGSLPTWARLNTDTYAKFTDAVEHAFISNEAVRKSSPTNFVDREQTAPSDLELEILSSTEKIKATFEQMGQDSRKIVTPDLKKSPELVYAPEDDKGNKPKDEDRLSAAMYQKIYKERKINFELPYLFDAILENDLFHHFVRNSAEIRGLVIDAVDITRRFFVSRTGRCPLIVVATEVKDLSYNADIHFACEVGNEHHTVLTLPMLGVQLEIDADPVEISKSMMLIGIVHFSALAENSAKTYIDRVAIQSGGLSNSISMTIQHLQNHAVYCQGHILIELRDDYTPSDLDERSISKFNSSSRTAIYIVKKGEARVRYRSLGDDELEEIDKSFSLQKEDWKRESWFNLKIAEDTDQASLSERTIDSLDPFTKKENDDTE